MEVIEFSAFSVDMLIGECDEPDRLRKEQIFCQQIPNEVYQQNIKDNTQKHLQNLMKYIDSNPEAYTKVLRKRRVEEIENGGFFSSLKLKIIRWLHGNDCPSCILNNEESTSKLETLKLGMERVFQYYQADQKISKQVEKPTLKLNSHQCSSDSSFITTRLVTARKKQKLSSDSPAEYSPFVHISLSSVLSVDQDDYIPSSHPTPPPPSSYFTHQQQSAQLQMVHPPLPSTPLYAYIYDEEDEENTEPDKSSDSYDTSNNTVPFIKADSLHKFKTPKEIQVRKNRRARSRYSNSPASSVSSRPSLLSDLQSVNPLNRLRQTTTIRSPGGTPAKQEEVTSTEPLQKALLVAFKRKFRNVRTPSPSVSHSRNTSIEDFSPKLLFSP